MLNQYKSFVIRNNNLSLKNFVNEIYNEIVATNSISLTQSTKKAIIDKFLNRIEKQSSLPLKGWK